jgi:hypothetical protein
MELSKEYVKKRIEKGYSYYSIFNDVFSVADIGTSSSYSNSLIEESDIENYLDRVLTEEYGVGFQEVIESCEKIDEDLDLSVVNNLIQSIADIRDYIEGQIFKERYKTIKLVDLLNRIHDDDDSLGDITIYGEDDEIKYEVVIEGQDFVEKYCEEKIKKYIEDDCIPFTHYTYDW